MEAEPRLPALSLPGLSPDSLGNYLASLGLLRVLSRKWASARIAWHDDILRVVGGPSTLDELLDEFVRVATSREWTPYERSWSEAQKKSSDLAKDKKTAASSGVPFALWQAEASEESLDGFVAHVVPHRAGRSMNPILGKAGKIGQRDFAKGWARGVELLAPPPPSKPRKNDNEDKKKARERADAEKVGIEAARKRAELTSLLRGDVITWLEKDLNAATWFSTANKLYNNGQSVFRDGLISPWAMVLACEGLTFLAGGASRRLAARARTFGAFPFVTRSAAPGPRGEAGRDAAELWAPIWGRPMTAPEVGALFRRGRAELGNHAALTPGAFATAILRRGVDAGVTEFRRFVLGWTTAQDYLEPRFLGAFQPPARESGMNAATTALERVTAFIEQPRFPRDRKVGQRWRVAGIRGPIEGALLGVASQPNDPEPAVAMLDAIVTSLDRIDRNRSFRKEQVRWEPLPVEWLPSLFGEQPPSVEARLALSLVSGFPVSLPFAVHRFGVEWKHGRFEHTERPPARWVWGSGELPRVLSAVLARRILEEESTGRDVKASSGRAPLPATCSQVSQWLDGDVDEGLLVKWISRFALFDWRKVPRQVCDLVESVSPPPRVDGALGLFGLLQPLVDRRPVSFDRSKPRSDLFAPDTGARTSAVARSLVSLVRAGSLDAGLRIASSRYAMAGVFLARVDASWAIKSPERLLASLLFTIPDRDRTVLIERWLRPRRRQQGDEAHV